MTDLMENLYCFAQENRVAKYLYYDTEYRDSLECASKGEQALRATLTEEQNERLDALFGERLICHSAELEAIFQSGFSMALELVRG